MTIDHDRSQETGGEEPSFASAAKQRVRQEVHRQRETLGRSVVDFADAMRKAADDLQAKEQNLVSRLLGEAAIGLESVSRTISTTEPEDVLREVKDFGRRKPTAFIIGLSLVGFAATRFAKSSERRHSVASGKTIRPGIPDPVSSTTAGQPPHASFSSSTREF